MNPIIVSLIIISLSLLTVEGASTLSPISKRNADQPPIPKEQISEEHEEALKKAEAEYQIKLATFEKEWKAATNNLGTYHTIAGANPFRLTKEKIKRPIVKTPPKSSVNLPRLIGISTLRNHIRAVLRVNPLGGGPAEYKFVFEKEAVDGVEVVKIYQEKGWVDIKIKNKIHKLKLKE